MNVLVTGGAGFIGTHLVRRLLREGCSVTILDNFSPQIHGDNCALPSDVSGNVELQIGDVRGETAVARALKGQEIVVHLAAETGTGQSMYEVVRYEKVNIQGTAVLMHCLVNNKASSVRKIVLASSRAVYGEGKYSCPVDGDVYPEARKVDDLVAGRFEPSCPVCGATCQVQLTAEDSPLQPSSFYGLTKQNQEQMIALFSKSLGFSWTGLRYQNVYGPGQSLQNPYTGILAIFSNQARAQLPINIFEDGLESRDFVYIDDVVEATWRAVAGTTMHAGALNVGSGARVTVSEVVREITDFFSSDSQVSISGMFRQGDIRHCIADLTKARRLIGFEPKWRFHDGIQQFLAWAASEASAPDRYESSIEEMRERGLLHGGNLKKKVARA
jgi:dTDP-L-rhamnose 4-epimerase